MKKCISYQSNLKDETSTLTGNNLPQIDAKLSIELFDETGIFKLSN